MKEIIIFIWYLVTVGLFAGGLLTHNDSAKKHLNYLGSIVIAVMLYFHLTGRI